MHITESVEEVKTHTSPWNSTTEREHWSICSPVLPLYGEIYWKLSRLAWSICVSCWPPEDSGTTPLTPDLWKKRPHSDWPFPGDIKLVWEKFHDPDKISECPTSACSRELIESPESSWTAFETVNSSRWLMCRYDSTCGHLPLADLSPKVATYPQFEVFVISRKLNTDSISLSPPPPPRRDRPPFYRLSDLSVQYKNRGSYPLFHLYLKGTKMYVKFTAA